MGPLLQLGWEQHALFLIIVAIENTIFIQENDRSILFGTFFNQNMPSFFNHVLLFESSSLEKVIGSTWTPSGYQH